MAEGQSLFIIVMAFDGLGIILGTFTLILYKKLKILKKSPGSLIFMQLLILTLLQFEDLFYYSFPYNESTKAYTIYSIYFYIYGNITIVNYVICTSFEVLLRIRNSPMGKDYRKRAHLYHIFCNLIGVVYMTIVLNFKKDYSTDGSLEFEVDSWIRYLLLSWYIVSVPCIQVIFTILTILICIYHIRKERDTPKSRFLRHIGYYLGATTLSKIGHMAFDFLYYATILPQNLWLYGGLCIVSAWVDVSVFVVRLAEPNIRRYLKDCFVFYRIKIKYLKKTLRNKQNRDEGMLSNRPSTDFNVMFEDLKLEDIEYQLIALSIILFKNYCTIQAISLKQT